MSKQKIIELKDLFQAQLEDAIKERERQCRIGQMNYYLGKELAMEYVINKLEEYLESN